MNPFAYQDRQLYAENVRLADVADKVGTPCYVYSRAASRSASVPSIPR